MTTTPAPSASGERATQGSSAFEFRGGSRYTVILLAVVLPFAWLAVLYFALANLLSEVALERGASKQTETRLEELEREVQALRSELAAAPRTAKSSPLRKSKKPDKSEDELEDAAPEDEPEPEDAPPEDAKAKAAEKVSRKIPQKYAKLSVSQMEKEISKLEESLASLEGSFSNPKVAANPQARKELQAKYAQGKKDLSDLMAAWEIKAEQGQ